jgi:DNA mismatch repair protein MutL
MPHATSKIQREEDLFAVRTMGFRGEALASIGAVSQLRIVSRQVEADQAHEVLVIANRMEPVRAAAGQGGTSVEVRELFFNVPARRKFLRTAQTEMGHITEQLARIATQHEDFRAVLDSLEEGVIGTESMRRALGDALPRRFLEQNTRAFDLGYEEMRQQL